MSDSHPHEDMPDSTKTEQNAYEDVPYREFAARDASPDAAAPNALPATPLAENISATPPFPPDQPQRQTRKGYIYGIIGAILAVLVILAGCYAIFFSGWFAPKSNPTSSAFHTAKCPFTLGAGIVDGKSVTCGYLTVPEDYSRPHGKTIQLAVATFKAAPSLASSTPFLYLTGGPGGGVLNDLGSYFSSSNASSITLGHDFILLDQRGTGFSKPALTCHEADDLSTATLDQNLSRDLGSIEYIQAMQTCHDRLVKSGVNLNAYTTIANATDVHTLIQALGYKQVDLYGVSYGTRLAQTVMRLFPADLHSVTLDSTVPTQNILFNDIPGVTQHAYDVLFKGCAASPTCSAEYPQLDTTFYNLVNTLNTTPATFQDVKYGPILLNGDSLASWLFSAQYVTRFIPYLPEIITQVSKGDYSLLSKIYTLLVLNQGISFGMYYSIECGEDMAFTTLSTVEQATKVARPEVQPGILAGSQNDYAVCKLWGQKPVPEVQKQPVKSAVPTLILSGEYDPITPAANGHLVAQNLSKSYFVLFPATGHGVFLTGTCPDNVIASFMLHPAQMPAETCVVTLQEPAFQ